MACGHRPAIAVAGESFGVSATIFREGHGIINAGVVRRGPQGGTGGRTAPPKGGPGGWVPPGKTAGGLEGSSPLVYMRELAPGTDRWGADVTVISTGLWWFHVEAWADPIASWHHDAAIKIPAGQDVELMLTEGALLIERAARRIPQPPGADRPADDVDEITAMFAEAAGDAARAAQAGTRVILSPSRHTYLDVPYAEPPADPGQAERQGRVGLRLYSPRTVAESFRLGARRGARARPGARRGRDDRHAATASTEQAGRRQVPPADRRP